MSFIYRLWILLLLIFQPTFLFSQTKIKNDFEAGLAVEKASQYYNSFNFDESLKSIGFVLEYGLKNNKYNLVAESYNLIGRNYNRVKLYKKSIHYLNKATFYGLKNNNYELLCDIYNNLGSIYYFRLGELNNGIKNYKLSIENADKAKLKMDANSVKLNLAECYHKSGDYTNLIYYLKQVEKYISKLKKEEISENEYLIGWYYIVEGKYNIHLKEYKIAEEYYLKSIAISKNKENSKLDFFLADKYDAMYELHKITGKYKKALEYIEKRDEIEHEISLEKQKSNVIKSDNSLQVKEASITISKIESEKKLKDKIIQKTALYNKIFTVLSLFLLIICISFFYSIRKNIKINKQLIVAKEIAEEAHLVKSRFISTITHELRTPLYGVIGIVNILEEEYVELKDSKYLKSLQFSANYLLNLVNDVLRLSKIEEQVTVLDIVEFHLKNEVQTIIETLKVLAKSKNIDLDLEIDSAIPTMVYTDKIRLSQILINLLSNGIKFTNQGSVKVKIILNNRNLEFYNLTFKIIDTGMGIPDSHIEKVFEEFIQVDRKEESNQGTGLGLSIVKKLVTRLGGSIKLTSQENVGTTVEFTLSVKEGNKFKSEKCDLILIENYKNYNFLVVDDNKINQMVTEKLLSSQNINSTIVYNGFDAIKMCKEKLFDMILMDIHMPVMDGFETTLEIRKFNKDTPIIALTASERTEYDPKITSYEINDILTKPFKMQELNILIKKYIV